ncbi:hypothetical protein Elgi_27430 [Paenibacillus elgii]|uniref:DUF6345 domain-containing protein n=1 Tax=Paenibacillus elgii TaxID=189691 RepID=UPI002D7ABB71|nr:hypothetical protein Elgi_27430 [Paenibacillus elgii]
MFPKKLLISSVLTAVLSISSVNAATIDLGATNPAGYQKYGNCAHEDRYSGAVYTDKFINGFFDPVLNYWYANKKFLYRDNNSWETDLLHSGMYKIGYDNVDSVDFMVFTGHGYGPGGHGVTYNSNHFYTMNSSSLFHPSGDEGEREDNANADSNEIWWGYEGYNVSPKTKWVSTYSCNFLNDSNPKWASIMQGVHMVTGFGNVMYMYSDEGTYYSTQLRQNAKIKDAFFNAARAYQIHSADPVIARVLAADISKDDTIQNYSRKPAPIGGSDEYYYWSLTVQPSN